MFKKPLNMAGGFIFGGLLTVAGLLLQVVCGPVNWDVLSRPVNIILLLVFIPDLFQIPSGYEL